MDEKQDSNFSQTSTSKVFCLIIEDDPDAAFICKKALMDNGYQVEVITDGKKAELALESLSPDVILLDINLPLVRGDDLLHQIRNSAHLSQTLVILVTSNHLKAREIRDDSDLVLLKPITYTQIKTLVEDVIERSGKGLA